MQSARNNAARGNHHLKEPEVYKPQKIAKAPNAEKFSGRGAKRRASVSPSNNTATRTECPWEERSDRLESLMKRVGMSNNL
jgi:hypothetical protein